jgi:hypothetical protein
MPEARSGKIVGMDGIYANVAEIKTQLTLKKLERNLGTTLTHSKCPHTALRGTFR